MGFESLIVLCSGFGRLFQNVEQVAVVGGEASERQEVDDPHEKPDGRWDNTISAFFANRQLVVEFAYSFARDDLVVEGWVGAKAGLSGILASQNVAVRESVNQCGVWYAKKPYAE